MAYLHKLGQIKQETGGEREGGTHPPKSSFVMSMREINSSLSFVFVLVLLRSLGFLH